MHLKKLTPGNPTLNFPKILKLTTKYGRMQSEKAYPSPLRQSVKVSCQPRTGQDMTGLGTFRLLLHIRPTANQTI